MVEKKENVLYILFKKMDHFVDTIDLDLKKKNRRSMFDLNYLGSKPQSNAFILFSTFDGINQTALPRFK